MLGFAQVIWIFLYLCVYLVLVMGNYISNNTLPLLVCSYRSIPFEMCICNGCGATSLVLPSVEEQTPHSCDVVIFFLTYDMFGTWSPGPPEMIFIFLAHVLGDDLKKTSQPHLFCPQARGNVRIRFVSLWNWYYFLTLFVFIPPPPV